MKSVRGEAVSWSLALALPVAVLCVLPYSALRFRAREAPPRPAPFAAFVAIDAEQEAHAMRRAKSAWKSDGENAEIRPSDLIFETLPDDAPTPLARIEERARPAPPHLVPLRPAPYLPTRAAPAPATIPAEPDPPDLPFSRADLLKATGPLAQEPPPRHQ